MVSYKDICDLDFSHLDEYFQYIVDSKINGQSQQVKSLIKKLSKQQRQDFLRWFDASYYYEAADQEAQAEHREEASYFFNQCVTL